MSGEILSNDDSRREDATIALKAAKDLREYAFSKDKKKEQELIEVLSTRPTLMERFFPTQGQKISRDLAAKRLQQLIENDMQVVELHQRVYMQAAEIIAEVQLTKLGGEAAAEIARTFVVIKEETFKTIQDSTKRTRKDLFDRKREAEVDYAGDEEFLKDALDEIKLLKDMNMKSTENLVNKLMASLDGLQRIK